MVMVNGQKAPPLGVVKLVIDKGEERGGAEVKRWGYPCTAYGKQFLEEIQEIRDLVRRRKINTLARRVPRGNADIRGKRSQVTRERTAIQPRTIDVVDI